MNAYRISLLSLLNIVLITGLAWGLTTAPGEATSFTLLYSSNVSGEYEPCGG